jgi:hypothetical protein
MATAAEQLVEGPQGENASGVLQVDCTVHLAQQAATRQSKQVIVVNKSHLVVDQHLV